MMVASDKKHFLFQFQVIALLCHVHHDDKGTELDSRRAEQAVNIMQQINPLGN